MHFYTHCPKINRFWVRGFCNFDKEKPSFYKVKKTIFYKEQCDVSKNSQD